MQSGSADSLPQDRAGLGSMRQPMGCSPATSTEQGREDWLESTEKHRKANRRWFQCKISGNFTTRGKIQGILEKKQNSKGGNKSRTTIVKHPYNAESSWHKNIKNQFFMKIH